MKYRPMLAILGGKENLIKKGFIYEPKLDGYRALCYKNKELNFISRNGNNLSKNYPELNFADKIKARTAVLDGEIIIYDENGNPNFQLLQNKARNRLEATYVAFDILMKNGKDLTQLPLKKRKQVLSQTVKDDENIQKSFFIHDGKKLWKVIEKRNLEGVIAKKYNSQYKQTRSSDWIKIKRIKTIDAVIIGYTSKKRHISSLLLGLYKDNTIIKIGKVGTGFNDKELRDFREKFEKIALKKEKNTTYIQPIYVCETAYSEITSENILRQPSFVRLRPDKKARECTFKDNPALK
jgi:bifunctional non-homologous end joining protein LigD